MVFVYRLLHPDTAHHMTTGLLAAISRLAKGGNAEKLVVQSPRIPGRLVGGLSTHPVTQRCSLP